MMGKLKFDPVSPQESSAEETRQRDVSDRAGKLWQKYSPYLRYVSEDLRPAGQSVDPFVVANMDRGGDEVAMAFPGNFNKSGHSGAGKKAVTDEEGRRERDVSGGGNGVLFI